MTSNADPTVAQRANDVLVELEANGLKDRSKKELVECKDIMYQRLLSPCAQVAEQRFRGAIDWINDKLGE